MRKRAIKPFKLSKSRKKSPKIRIKVPKSRIRIPKSRSKKRLKSTPLTPVKNSYQHRAERLLQWFLLVLITLVPLVSDYMLTETSPSSLFSFMVSFAETGGFLLSAIAILTEALFNLSKRSKRSNLLGLSLCGFSLLFLGPALCMLLPLSGETPDNELLLTYFLGVYPVSLLLGFLTKISE